MNNMTEVAWDRFNQPIIWQDRANRLWTYYGNDMVECDAEGNPIGAGAGNDDLLPVEYDRYGQPIRWEDRNGIVYILDAKGNLVEDPVYNRMPQRVPGTGYVKPNTGTANYIKPGSNNIADTTVGKNHKSASGVTITSRYGSNSVEEPTSQQQQRVYNNQSVVQKIPSLTLVGYSCTGKYKHYPLVDQTQYVVSIEVDKKNRTYKYTIKNKE